jgi:ferritin
MHQKIVELLNEAVAYELSVVYEYMHSRFHCDDQCHDLLALLFMRVGIKEIPHEIAQLLPAVQRPGILAIASEAGAKKPTRRRQKR